MGEFPNKATQFTSENQPANKGRKKNKFTYLKEDTELSQNDFENIINYISSLPLLKYKEIIEKIKNKSTELDDMPIIIYKIIEAYSKADLDDIIKLMKAAGKAPDNTVNKNIDIVPEMTPEQIQARRKEIMDKIKKDMELNK